MIKTLAALSILSVLAAFVAFPAQAGSERTITVVDSNGAKLGGITVTGFATASAPADKAQVSLMIASRNSMQAPSAHDIEILEDALVNSGIERSSLRQTPPGQASAITISGTVYHPTAAAMQSGIQTLTAAFRSTPDVLLQRANVMLTISDCRALNSRTRREALDQAHAIAQEIATDGNVVLGSLVAVNAQGNGGQIPAESNACGAGYSFGDGPSIPMSASEMTDVRVFQNLTATYAIR